MRLARGRQTKKILDQGLKCILCIGELKEERESGETFNVCNTQLTKGLKDVSAEEMKKIVIAYEPIWAIGTGETATPGDAQEMCAHIRSRIAVTFGSKAAESVRIQYGGSVKPGNAPELMAQPDIDGALVGGASLDAEDFARIVKYRIYQA